MSSYTAAVHQHRNTAAPRISVVVPALNEARNLEVLLPELAAAVDCHEVVLVDGGSSDATVATARRVLPGVRVVRQVREGKGNAVAAGLAVVTGDIVVTIDADLACDPAEIPLFVRALVDGADAATGTRGAGATGSRAFDVAHTLMFGTGWADLRYGFHAFWADVVPLLELPDHRVMTPEAGQMFWGDGFEIEAVIACRLSAARVTVAAVPSVQRHRRFGRSKLRAGADGVRLARTLVAEWRRARGVRRLERAVLHTAPAVRPARPAPAPA